MTGDIPHLLNTVSLGEVRESLAIRRQWQVQRKFEPDEGARYDRIQAEIRAENAAKAKAKRGKR